MNNSSSKHLNETYGTESTSLRAGFYPTGVPPLSTATACPLNQNASVLLAEAEQGSAEAQYRLFDYLSAGHQIDNCPGAEYWLARAVEQGYPQALYTDALIQIQKSEEGKVPPQALFFLQAAGDRGYSDAYLQLYHLYLEGRGIERNEDEAIAYLRKAMEAGSGTAYLIVAKSFLPAGGGPIDYDASYYYAEQAAHLGCLESVDLILELLDNNLVNGDHTELLSYWRRQQMPKH